MQELRTPVQAAQWLKSCASGALWADSRKVRAGDGFVAWPGAAVDARRFAASAIAQGAGACLMERDGVESYGLSGDAYATYAGLKADTGPIAAEFYGQPSRALDVVAVTGTNGKTSTAWWLAQALTQLPAGRALACGVIGTLGVGIPPDVVSTGLTTPDPVLLQQTLRAFVDTGLKACAMEASSIGVEEHRLDGTEVRVAVFTNFTQDHLDYHGSMASYWEAKRRLFDWPGLQAAVINVDDTQGVQLAADLAARPLDVWTTSCRQAARLQACNIEYEASGLRFDVVEDGQTVPLHSHLIGTYNVANMLGVIAAMRSLGVQLADAVQACSGLMPVPGRMECVGGSGEPLVAVDYAHTPDALEQALVALRPLAEQRQGALWCIFGCGGDRDASKRPMMGAIAARRADRVVVTSDNPRSEKPETIIAQILLGLPQTDAVSVQADRALAIAHTLAEVADQDVVLLAGKGHEATQEVAGSKLSFSDRTHAEQALQARRRSRGVRP
jgi:UDP-N-acetylmuramoyl-L-alanyl-D-glutamate--2,6-diaminopimelate ligase